MNYRYLHGPELKRILEQNPPDTPHYQRALVALESDAHEKAIRIQKWLLAIGVTGLLLELLRLALMSH